MPHCLAAPQQHQWIKEEKKYYRILSKQKSVWNVFRDGFFQEFYFSFDLIGEQISWLQMSPKSSICIRRRESWLILSNSKLFYQQTDPSAADNFMSVTIIIMLVGYVVLLDAVEREEKSLSEIHTVVLKLAGVKDGMEILRKVQMRWGIKRRKIVSLIYG